MTRNRLIIISGWAHTPDDVSPLCNILNRRFDIQVTSTAKLYSPTPGRMPASPYAENLFGLISKAVEPPTVLAWSMGALVTIETLSKLNAKLSRVVFVSGTSRFCSDTNYPCGIPEAILRAMSASIRKNPEETLLSFYKDASFPETAANKLLEEKTRRTLSLGSEHLTAGLDYLRKTDLRMKLDAIKIPTLIIHGTQDKIIPVSAAEFLKDKIAGSRLITHSTAGHTLILDHPDLVAEDIRSFTEA